MINQRACGSLRESSEERQIIGGFRGGGSSRGPTRREFAASRMVGTTAIGSWGALHSGVTKGKGSEQKERVGKKNLPTKKPKAKEIERESSVQPAGELSSGVDEPLQKKEREPSVKKGRLPE